MSPAIFRRLPMLRQVIAVLLLIVMALGAPGSAMAAEFDLDRLRATPLPSKTNLSEEVIRAEQNARDNIQQDRVDALSQLLARTDRSGKACVNNSTGNWQTSSSRPTNMPTRRGYQILDHVFSASRSRRFHCSTVCSRDACRTIDARG